MMMVTMMFTWHVAAVAVGFFVLGAILYRCAKRGNNGIPSSTSAEERNGGLKYRPLSQKEGMAVLSMVSEDEDDFD